MVIYKIYKKMFAIDLLKRLGIKFNRLYAYSYDPKVIDAFMLLLDKPKYYTVACYINNIEEHKKIYGKNGVYNKLEALILRVERNDEFIVTRRCDMEKTLKSLYKGCDSV